MGCCSSLRMKSEVINPCKIPKVIETKVEAEILYKENHKVDQIDNLPKSDLSIVKNIKQESNHSPKLSPSISQLNVFIGDSGENSLEENHNFNHEAENKGSDTCKRMNTEYLPD